MKVLVLPDNADPDGYIRKFGVSEYQRQRAQAQPHIQFVIESALRDRNFHRPAEKAEAVEEVLPYIRAVNSRITKREFPTWRWMRSGSIVRTEHVYLAT